MLYCYLFCMIIIICCRTVLAMIFLWTRRQCLFLLMTRTSKSLYHIVFISSQRFRFLTMTTTTKKNPTKGVLGDATSTIAAGESALRLYAAFRRQHGRCVHDDMLYVEIVADNLEFEILSFSKWCSSTPIPKSFDDNLQPTNKYNTEGPSKILMTSTLANTLEKHFCFSKENFHNTNELSFSVWRLFVDDVSFWCVVTVIVVVGLFGF